MRKILLAGLLLATLFSCRKNTEKSDQEVVKNYKNEIEKPATIDFEKMEKLVKDSQEISLDVFFAISVLHKYTISQYEIQTAALTDEEKKQFFDRKKKDFFKNIKYSEKEYNQFWINNQELINAYINENPEIVQYLSSF